MNIQYRDLEIEIDRCCHCGEQEIRILESLLGRPRTCFELDDARRAALEKKVEEFEQLPLEGEEALSRRWQLAKSIGMELYEILLPSPIRGTFERSRDAARSLNEGLRLRLSFGRPYDRQAASTRRGPDSDGAPEGTYDYLLGSLPWELLCNPENHRFLGNQSETPVVRYLDLGERIEPLDVEPPLKVLAVIASPEPDESKRYRFTKFDPAPQRLILEQAIQGGNYLQLRFPERPTLPAVHDELIGAERAGKPYHAVHFVGHGSFNKKNEGVLLFESDYGDGEHLVTGRELADQLTPDVRFVVLASCHTGKIPLLRAGGQHPFTGVASALVAARKSAVVAMQFSVSEEAAAAFAGKFYEAIDANAPIDDAVTQGRLAIQVGREEDVEWATPVLFMRSRDGQLLRLRKDDGLPSRTVAVFNVQDLGWKGMKHVDLEVDLRSYFDGRYIHRWEDWNGAIMDRLRQTLRGKLSGENPCHFEFAAPLSVAFACGFLLPAKERRQITVEQRGRTWHLDEEPPPYAPSWLDEEAARQRIPSDFPLEPEATDIAVVIESSLGQVLGDVTAYLRRRDLDPSIPSHPPRIREVIYSTFAEPDQFAIKSGGHARRLAARLVERVAGVARDLGYPTIHLFLAGPHGLALALGRACRVLPRIQLYEFDFEKKRHQTYEPSMTLVPPEMGETP